MGLKPIDIGHCICLGQYEHLHIISYSPFFIGLGLGRCQCENTLRFKTNAFRSPIIVLQVTWMTIQVLQSLRQVNYKDSTVLKFVRQVNCKTLCMLWDLMI